MPDGTRREINYIRLFFAPLIEILSTYANIDNGSSFVSYRCDPPWLFLEIHHQAPVLWYEEVVIYIFSIFNKYLSDPPINQPINQSINQSVNPLRPFLQIR